MKDMERREEFIEQLINMIEAEKNKPMDLPLLLRIAYQEGYADGLESGYEGAIGIYARPIPFGCCD